MSESPTLTEPLRFGREVTPASVGMRSAGVQRVAALFEAQVAGGQHPGAQLVVLRHGRVVLDRAAGMGDLRRGWPITPQTPFLTFSITKPFAALCLHHLIEQGRVALDDPIALYWPEFGQRGKETATLRHALLHQVGIPARGLERQTLLWPSWRCSTRDVAALPAEWEPGSRTAYHIVNFGFLVGEVVRRVTGVPIDLYLHQHFLRPMGLQHTWLGLPPDQWEHSPRLVWTHPDHRSASILFNVLAIRRAVLPAATLHSTARDLATFYEMLRNGGCYAGRRYLQPETVAAATTLGYEGYDETLGTGIRWGYGFQLGGSDPAKGIAPDGSPMGVGSSARTFGHFGNATCMTWADPPAGLVVAFVCNGLLSRDDSRARWRALSDAIWDAVDPG